MSNVVVGIFFFFLLFTLFICYFWYQHHIQFIIYLVCIYCLTFPVKVWYLCEFELLFFCFVYWYLMVCLCVCGKVCRFLLVSVMSKIFHGVTLMKRRLIYMLEGGFFWGYHSVTELAQGHSYTSSLYCYHW